MVADRWVLLDHLTRGRVIFGTGPGALPSDAYMMGIDPGRAAPDDAGVARGDPRAVPAAPEERDQPALRLVHAARRPAAHPAVHLAVPRDLHGSNDFPVRPAARRRARARRCCRCRCRCRAATPRWRTPGKSSSTRPRSRAATSPIAPTGGCWPSCTSPTPGTRRSTTAPTGCRTSRTTSARRASCRCRIPSRAAQSPREFVAEYAGKGNCCIGTPGDAIAYIQDLLEQSGGFGTLLLLGHDWASPAGDLPLLRTVRPRGHAALQGPADRAAGVARLGQGHARPAARPCRRGDRQGDQRAHRRTQVENGSKADARLGAARRPDGRCATTCPSRFPVRARCSSA